MQRAKKHLSQTVQSPSQQRGENLERSDSVTVKVGEGEEAVAWNLPGALLRHASPFFAAALSGPWPESESKTIEMKEDKPAAFRFFVRWMYMWVCSAEEKHPTQVVNNVSTTVCTHAWVLGDKLLCPHFQDFALISLHARLTKSEEDLASVIAVHIAILYRSPNCATLGPVSSWTGS
ncbi:MAG: hypothetical protein Q9197_003889 [Variospora fuerteventurae]